MSKFINYRNLYQEQTKNLEIILADETKTKENFDNLKSSNLKLETEKNDLNSRVTDITFEKLQLENKINALSNTISQLEMGAEIKNAELEIGVELFKSYKNISLLNGQWNFTYQNQIKKLVFQQILEIKDGTISIVDGSKKEEAFRITFFFHDTINKKLHLHLKFLPEILTGKYPFVEMENSTLLAQILEDKYKIPSRLNTEIFLIHELQVIDENQFSGTENVTGLIQYKRIQ